MPHGPDTTRDGQSRGDRNLNPADFHFSVHPESLEEFEAESHDEFRIRTFHGDKYVAGADYFTDDYDEVQRWSTIPPLGRCTSCLIPQQIMLFLNRPTTTST